MKQFHASHTQRRTEVSSRGGKNIIDDTDGETQKRMEATLILRMAQSEARWHPRQLEKSTIAIAIILHRHVSFLKLVHSSPVSIEIIKVLIIVYKNQ